MSELIVVTGGSRSGKSEFAQQLAEANATKILYVATATPFDEEMRHRIALHKASRDERYQLIERYQGFEKLDINLISENQVVLVDCMTLMVTNILLGRITSDEINISQSMDLQTTAKEEVSEMIAFFLKIIPRVILVTNETGMGIIPENKLSRVFCDINGKINQMIAQKADTVYFCVSGIPIKIKG